MREDIPLSEDLKHWRAERPDEWTMDRFIRKAILLEGLVTGYLTEPCDHLPNTVTEGIMSEFKQYQRTAIAEMRPYIDGEKLPENVSISQVDLDNGSPKFGDMIARNPQNHNDQWLVAADYFSENFCAVGEGDNRGDLV